MEGDAALTGKADVEKNLIQSPTECDAAEPEPGPTTIHADMIQEKEHVIDDPGLLQAQDKLEDLHLSDLIITETSAGQSDVKTETEDEKFDEEIAAISESADADSESKTDDDKKPSTLGLFTKVVFRNLPPSLTEEEFLQIIRPEPEDYNYYHFTFASKLYGPEVMGAAYFNFLEPEVADLYIERFNGYLVIDLEGGEYPMEVDFAICQSIPKPQTEEDSLMGTVEESEIFKEFLAMYEESPDGVIGIKPRFTDAKAMSEYVLNEINEREQNRDKLQSTPLLDSLRDKLKAERDKRLRDREEQVRRRKEKERERQRQKAERREKRERERKERRDKERRERAERDKRDKEKRAAERQRQEGVSDNPEKGADAQKPESATAKDTQLDKKEKEPKKEKDGESSSAKKDTPAAAPSSSRHHRGSRDYDHKQEGYRDDKDYVPRPPRRSYNERRNRNDRRQGQGADQEKDRPGPPKKDDHRGPEKQNTSESKAGGTQEQIRKESTSSQGTDSKSNPVSTGAGAVAGTKDAEKPKTKVVKKVVKIVRVKSKDGVPTEGKVIEKTVVKADEKRKQIPENSKEQHPSSSKSRAEASAGGSGPGSADRPRRGRPDQQIYRPGSWRDRNPGPGSSKPGNNAANKNNKAKPEMDAPKVKPNEPEKAKEAPDG